MSKHILNGAYDETYAITESGNYSFVKNCVVAPYDPGNGIAESDTLHSVISIDGVVIASDSAFSSTGFGIKLTVTANGILSGGYDAVNILGLNAVVHNAGNLVAASYGVEGRGNDATIVNTGTVRGGYGGLAVWGDGGSITNEKSGYVYGASGGLVSYSDAGDKAEIVNHGYVKSLFAFDGRDGNETFRNDGTLVGIVSLGDGNDVFDNRGGKLLKGHIQDGGGDDTYILNQNIKVYEQLDGGDDTIKSTVSFKLVATTYVEHLILQGARNIDATGSLHDEAIIGNSGNNVLKGLDGEDVIDGGKGNDILYGGTGGDTIVFATGDGKDVLKDFDVADVIDVRGWKPMKDFDHVKDHARNHGDDVVISAGHDSLTIADTHLKDLLATDFMF